LEERGRNAPLFFMGFRTKELVKTPQRW
jgi:hypothetical protein